MKITRLLSSLSVLTLCLAVLTSASFAKNNPLASPAGLAVDAASNLYVANFGAAKNILIYNSGYAQQTSKTITQGITGPAGVAIDLYGNLWVANLSFQATEYTGGVQNTSATIDLTFQPSIIAIDGLDNLWVEGFGAGGVAIYSPTGVYAPPSNLVRTLSTGTTTCIAVGAGAFYYGTSTQTFLESASATLLGSPLSSLAYAFGCVAAAPDNKGNIYFVDTSGNVWIALPNSTATVFVTLPFAPVATNPNGLVVDNVKQRLYVANFDGNEIFVYSIKPGSTYGTSIHKMCNTPTCP